MIRAGVLAALLLALCPVPAAAGLPLVPERVLTIRPERTTWTSLDISADGRTIVFDVLGDLYQMPAGGGTARQISDGLAFDSQPRFSPDGQWIAFTSDRSGSENLWIARSDGSQARAITAFDDETVMVSPTWSADGRAVFASRYRAEVNNYELWRFPLDGAGELLVPVKPTPDAPRELWRSTLDASASADGKWLYYARRVGGMEFDKPTRWTILRRELATGAEQEVIAGSGGRGTDEDAFFAPRIAPDGRRLAYVTRREGKSLLRLRDLATGADIPLGETQADAMQASSWQGMVPGMAFTPDGSALVLSRAGRFEHQPLDGSAATVLPRSITARVAVGPSTRFAIKEDTGPVESKLAMAPVASPDGQSIAFAALGSLRVQALGEAEARRLPLGPDMPAQPAWSPDGSQLAYVTWSEAEGGAAWIASVDAQSPRKLTTLPAYYRYPVFAPGGQRLLVLRSPMEERRQSGFEYGPLRESELVEIDPAAGTARIVARGQFGGRPHFVDGQRGAAYLMADTGLVRVDLASGKADPVARITGPSYYFVEGNSPVDDMRISPDGLHIAAVIADRLYVLPRPADPGVAVDVLAADSPARVLPGLGADAFEWSAGGNLDAITGTLWSRRDAATGAEVTGMRLTAKLSRAAPTGSLLLRGARVLTMAQGDRVIDDADVLVTADRIAAVAPRGTLTVPEGTAVRDVTGKTIMPGLIDVHDHIGEIRRDNWASEAWGLRARLAYGVTTAFDPSTLSNDQIGYEGLLDAGEALGPRLRSTGTAVFSKVRITSLDDARRVLRRYSQGYRIANLKEYRTGDREVRQWIAMAAREQGLLPTTEGALSLKLDLTQILDGYAGSEHALPAAPLGDDVIALMQAMRTSYDTTLSITNSGAGAMDWIIAHEDPVADEKLRRFWPPPAIQQKLLRGREFRPLATERFPAIAADAARLADAGVLVGIGSHGEAPGIGYHWEMQAHALGGMSAPAILHAATAGSAEAIGRLSDLGTIEPGKLADLLILSADPRQDLRHARRIEAVMRGGFLYEGETLRPLWPVAADAPRAWFAKMDAQQWLPQSEPERPDEHR